MATTKKKIDRVTLVCTHMKGRYPKLRTKNFPNGLVFRNSMIVMSPADFKQLSEHEDTAYMWDNLHGKGEIRVLGVDTNTVPRNENVRVVRGTPVSTSTREMVEPKGPARDPHEKVDDFEPAASGTDSAGGVKSGIELEV